MDQDKALRSFNTPIPKVTGLRPLVLTFLMVGGLGLCLPDLSRFVASECQGHSHGVPHDGTQSGESKDTESKKASLDDDDTMKTLHKTAWGIVNSLLAQRQVLCCRQYSLYHPSIEVPPPRS